MAITKTQLEYLDKRLGEIACDKINRFQTKNHLKTAMTNRERYDLVVAGKVKPRPFHEQGYNCASICFDFSKEEKKLEQARARLNRFKEEVAAKMNEIKDRVVLKDLNLETALNELQNF